MKTLLKTLTATAFGALFLVPVIGAEMSPVGKWQSQDRSAQYQVSYCGDGEQLCAKLTWLSAAAKAEVRGNVLNSYVVKGAVRSGPNRWSGTVVYDGDTYNGTVTLGSNGTMKLKGCSGIFCKSFALQRA